MTAPSLPDLSALAGRLQARVADFEPPPLLASGALTGVTGLTLEATGCAFPLGSRCRLTGPGAKAC